MRMRIGLGLVLAMCLAGVSYGQWTQLATNPSWWPYQDASVVPTLNTMDPNQRYTTDPLAAVQDRRTPVVFPNQRLNVRRRPWGSSEVQYDDLSAFHPGERLTQRSSRNHTVFRERLHAIDYQNIERTIQHEVLKTVIEYEDEVRSAFQHPAGNLIPVF